VGRSELETQSLSKSCHEALILAVLGDGPKHGYQLALDIAERSGGRFGFRHGTLYPILHKLEKEGLIEGHWSAEGPRGKRKAYALTRRGRAYAREQREAWRGFIDQFLAVIGKEEA
jgi:DNA-binding PadR family transcriptional regulator